MRCNLLFLGFLVSVVGCSSGAQFASASGGSSGKTGSGGKGAGGGSAGKTGSGGKGAGGSVGTAGSSSGGGGGAATGGASGSGGAGSGISDAGVAEAGVEAGAATPCTDHCAPGQFCSTTACGMHGTCVPDSNGGGLIGPVCGCDGLTYWSAALANTNRAAVAQQAACSPNAGNVVKCQNGFCPTGEYCNRVQQATGDLCSGSSLDTCWVMPSDCPGKPRGKACGLVSCDSMCSLIEKQEPWHTATLVACPP